MKDDTDIRWKQRYQNFDRAFRLLDSALSERSLEELSDLEQEGVIQRFEYTYELAWKSMKDYLESSGLVISPTTPRQVIKEAFAAGVVEDGQLWIDLLLLRNLLSHTYSQKCFQDALFVIRDRFLDAFRSLHRWLGERRDI